MAPPVAARGSAWRRGSAFPGTKSQIGISARDFPLAPRGHAGSFAQQDPRNESRMQALAAARAVRRCKFRRNDG
jgi:hypothetical protein